MPGIDRNRHNMKGQGFFEYVNELFADIEGITSKRMFGGYGFYRDGMFFALIADGKLYFKVTEHNRTEYEKSGSGPFVYQMKDGKSTTMSYWEVPGDIMEDRTLLPEWVEKAVVAAREAKKHK